MVGSPRLNSLVRVADGCQYGDPMVPQLTVCVHDVTPPLEGEHDAPAVRVGGFPHPASVPTNPACRNSLFEARP